MSEPVVNIPGAPPAWPGHTVLAVPVPGLDAPVRARTAHYDPSFVSADPDFVHAHITVLAPWSPAPDPSELAVVEQIVADHRRRYPHGVTITLARVEEFPGGVIHLVPDPATPFVELTAALSAAFEHYPPYAGRFPDPVPHLTLDHPAGGVTVAEVRARIAAYLPMTFPLDHLDLQWWANHDCRLLRRWSLAPEPAPVPAQETR